MVELDKNKQEEGKLFVNKLSAAERQLAAAIRMYFMEEDALAVHIVASAALNLYADLMKARNKEPAIHGVMYGFFRSARDVLEGEFSIDDFDSWGEEGLRLIKEIIEFLKKHPEFDIEELEVNGPSKFIRQFWNEKRKSYNFLKHADRDSDQLLDEAHVNNEDIISDAINNALHLNCEMTPEKKFFVSSWYVTKLGSNAPPDLLLTWVLIQLSKEERMSLARRNFCYPRVNDDYEIDLESKCKTADKMYRDRKKSKSDLPSIFGETVDKGQ